MLGGPTALLRHDPEFVSARKVYAKLHNIANTQKAKRRKLSVRSGDNKGKPWPTKHILTYLRNFSTTKAKPKAKSKAKAKAKAKAEANIAKDPHAAGHGCPRARG